MRNISLMKQFILVSLLTIVTFNIYSVVDENIVPAKLNRGFLSSDEDTILDDDLQTGVSLYGKEIEIGIHNIVVIKDIISLDMLFEGDIEVDLLEDEQVIMQYKLSNSLKKINQIDLSRVKINYSCNYELHIRQSNNSLFTAALYNVSLLALIDNTPVNTYGVNAQDNTAKINIPNLDSNTNISMNVGFEADDFEEVEGILVVDNNKGDVYRYNVMIPAYQTNKTVYFDYVPLSQNTDFVVSFESRSGNLSWLTFRKQYPVNNVDIQQVGFIGDDRNIYINNLLDNNNTTETFGDWNRSNTGTFDVKLTSMSNQVYISYFWMPGMSEKVVLEAVFEDGTYQQIMEHNSVAYEYQGLNNRFKADYENLRLPGWKVFNTGVLEKKIRSIRLTLTGSKTFGGISNIMVFNTNQSEVLYSGRGYVYPNSNTQVLIRNINTNAISSQTFSYNNIRPNFITTAFQNIADDIFNTRNVNRNGSEWIVPNIHPSNSRIVLELENDGYYDINNIDITGHSPYHSNIIRVNDGYVQNDISNAGNGFRTTLSYQRDGQYYITSEVGDDFNLRKRIDRVVIDTEPPVIYVDYPRTTYVNAVESPIRGYVYDLSLKRVTINDIECELFGRWFELPNANVDIQNKQYVIKAYDMTGYVSTKTITLKVDSANPVVTITDPINQSCLNANRINIVGSVSDMSATQILCRGKNVTLAAGGGDFTLSNIDLNEGVDNIEITVIDEAENRTVHPLTLEIDNTKPVFTNNQTKYYVNDDSITINIGVNELFGCTLMHGKSSLNLTPAELVSSSIKYGEYYNANYSFTVALTTNITPYYIEATDKAGNVSSLYLEIIKDETAPIINVLTPVDGYTTYYNVIDVIGNVVEDNLLELTVNDNVAIVEGGNFNYRGLALPLDGENTITIRAVDKAGNSSLKVITVNKDVIPPNSPEVAAVYNDGVVNVNWSLEDEASEVDHFVVRRIPEFTNTATLIVTEHSIVDEDNIDFEVNQIYTYYVQSVDRAGNKSEWKSGATGVTRAYVPGQPGGVNFRHLKMRWSGEQMDSAQEIKILATDDADMKPEGLFASPIYI